MKYLKRFLAKYEIKKTVVQSLISAFVFVIVIIAVLIPFTLIKPSSEAYIGIIAAFIGISVAIVIVFQIYNAIDMNSRIMTFEKDLQFQISKNISLNDRLIEVYSVNMQSCSAIFIIEAEKFYKIKNFKYCFFLYVRCYRFYTMFLVHEHDTKEHVKILTDESEINIVKRIFKIALNLIQKEKLEDLSKAYTEKDLLIKQLGRSNPFVIDLVKVFNLINNNNINIKIKQEQLLEIQNKYSHYV